MGPVDGRGASVEGYEAGDPCEARVAGAPAAAAVGEGTGDGVVVAVVDAGSGHLGAEVSGPLDLEMEP